MFTKNRALILTVAALLTACSNVASDNFQGEYMVVAPLPDGDSLNEREAPSAGAKIIDRLMPGTLVAVGERTVTEGTAWRQKAGDGGGWLAESFLKPADFRLIGDTSVPAGGTCSGFEPIWSLNWDEKHLTLELGNEIQQYPITQIIKAKGYRDALLVAANKPNYQITLRFEAASCPYLPVDAFMFGRGTLTIESKDQFAWYLGCCSPTASALNPGEDSQAVSAVTEGSHGPTSTEDFLAGKYALQIASRTSDQEVASLFETVSERLQNAAAADGLEIFWAQNGWYAIVVVTPSKIACNATRETLVSRALIPSDSYCNPGNGYIRRLRVKGGTLLSVYNEFGELPVDRLEGRWEHSNSAGCEDVDWQYILDIKRGPHHRARFTEPGKLKLEFYEGNCSVYDGFMVGNRLNVRVECINEGHAFSGLGSFIFHEKSKMAVSAPGWSGTILVEKCEESSSTKGSSLTYQDTEAAIKNR